MVKVQIKSHWPGTRSCCAAPGWRPAAPGVSGWPRTPPASGPCHWVAWEHNGDDNSLMRDYDAKIVMTLRRILIMIIMTRPCAEIIRKLSLVISVLWLGFEDTPIIKFTSIRHVTCREGDRNFSRPFARKFPRSRYFLGSELCDHCDGETHLA